MVFILFPVFVPNALQKWSGRWTCCYVGDLAGRAANELIAQHLEERTGQKWVANDTEVFFRYDGHRNFFPQLTTQWSD